MVAIIEQNSTDYYIFKGEPMGFQFEMLQQLGQFLGMEVEIIVSNNLDDDFDALYEGKADIIAKSIAPGEFREDIVSYSLPLYNTKHVLVQRRDVISNKFVVDNRKMLVEKNVYIPLRSSFTKTLNRLKKTSGINFFEMPEYNAEHLVELVASKELDYTVCNSEQARILARIYPELDFSTVLSEGNSVSWIFRKKSTDLRKKVNEWLSYYRSSAQFAVKFNKYFNEQNIYASTNPRYVSVRAGRISRYDELIKKYSAKIEWDWRLLASLIYQESRFNPKVRSHAGAYGIMQLMPSTRAYFGVDSSSSVEKQIEAGVKFIKLLDKQIAPKIPDKHERVKFILASYNIGWGHILDAVNIAHKVGKNAKKWDQNVDSCLMNKANPEFFQLSEVKHGYAKGRETYKFVRQILERYGHYRNLVSE
ncbi:MAG TPA: transporter substrate-binding domain-containing protein [Bacteroidales bacterium]|nr:transporter substrate-binding domain-containing protein [Bacteroidales bacterium]